MIHKNFAQEQYVREKTLRKLDANVRSMAASDMLDAQGELILAPLGVNASQRNDLLAAWSRLRNRRQRIADPDLVDVE